MPLSLPVRFSQAAPQSSHFIEELNQLLFLISLVDSQGKPIFLPPSLQPRGGRGALGEAGATCTAGPWCWGLGIRERLGPQLIVWCVCFGLPLVKLCNKWALGENPLFPLHFLCFANCCHEGVQSQVLGERSWGSHLAAWDPGTKAA